MLKKLSIHNYALIDELDIEFTDGMTIITGETGAGKSILLGALSMLLGQRADSASLLKKDKKCIIEGQFNISNYQLEDFFHDHDLDFDALTTIRREISPEGKSRSFINDTPVNLSALKELGGRLIDIHSQHETLNLNESAFQLMVVDSVAANESLIKKYKSEFNTYQSLKGGLNELKEAEIQSKKDHDYYLFLFTELDEAKLSPGEQEQLEQELQLQNNSEDIKSVLNSAQETIHGQDENILTALTSLITAVQGITKVFPKADELLNRLRASRIELKDIASDLQALEQDVNFDPNRAQIISERLDLIYKLQQKHRVSGTQALIEMRDSFDEKLNQIQSLEDQIKKVELSLAESFKKLDEVAFKIRANRIKSIPGIEKSIAASLSELGMKNAVLKIELTPLKEGEFRTNGADQINFLFSANKGVEYRDLDKVASGGELSRLMLCFKSLIARSTGLPTIIFDEIDSGISGEVAGKVGRIVKEMSSERQVIVITHLPQMAGKGDEHFFVYKETSKGGTSTKIRKLAQHERVEEIAKMLSGDHPTKASIANARELLGV